MRRFPAAARIFAFSNCSGEEARFGFGSSSSSKVLEQTFEMVFFIWRRPSHSLRLLFLATLRYFSPILKLRTCAPQTRDELGYNSDRISRMPWSADRPLDHTLQRSISSMRRRRSFISKQRAFKCQYLALILHFLTLRGVIKSSNLALNMDVTMSVSCLNLRARLCPDASVGGSKD